MDYLREKERMEERRKRRKTEEGKGKEKRRRRGKKGVKDMREREKSVCIATDMYYFPVCALYL